MYPPLFISIRIYRKNISNPLRILTVFLKKPSLSQEIVVTSSVVPGNISTMLILLWLLATAISSSTAASFSNGITIQDPPRKSLLDSDLSKGENAQHLLREERKHFVHFLYLAMCHLKSISLLFLLEMSKQLMRRHPQKLPRVLSGTKVSRPGV